MKFCPTCGRALPEGMVAHCPNCGAGVPAAVYEADRLVDDASRTSSEAAAAAKSLADQFEAIGNDPLNPAAPPQATAQPPPMNANIGPMWQPPIVEPPDLDVPPNTGASAEIAPGSSSLIEPARTDDVPDMTYVEGISGGSPAPQAGQPQTPPPQFGQSQYPPLQPPLSSPPPMAPPPPHYGQPQYPPPQYAQAPAPPYGQPQYPPPYGQSQYVPPYATGQPPKSKATALLIELLPGILFGLMGIGWMYAGKSDKGIWWLVGSIAWWVIMGLIGLLTVGIGCLCFPLIWVAAGISAYTLNNQMKAEPGRYQ